jgi:hypothetical protein
MEEKLAKEKPAPAAAPAVKKAVETWATEKGFLPRRAPGRVLRPALPLGAEVQQIAVANLGGALAAAAPAHNPTWWMYEASRVRDRWPAGMELTEAEFDAAIKAHDNPI